MKNLGELIELSLGYDEAFERRIERLKTWHDKSFKVVKETLQSLCTDLSSSVSFYRSNLHVVGDQTKSNDGVSIYSGLCNFGGYYEEGFQIRFAPTKNGRILIIAFEHAFKGEEGAKIIVANVEPGELSEEKVIDYVYQSLKKIQKSCVLFHGE